jgi:hypothetical protein
MDLAGMKPTADPLHCSTTFCLVNAGKEYLAYQPAAKAGIVLQLPSGSYDVETFDTAEGSTAMNAIKWEGGNRNFPKPSHVNEDWVLYVKARS